MSDRSREKRRKLRSERNRLLMDGLCDWGDGVDRSLTASGVSPEELEVRRKKALRYLRRKVDEGAAATAKQKTFVMQNMVQIIKGRELLPERKVVDRGLDKRRRGGEGGVAEEHVRLRALRRRPQE